MVTSDPTPVSSPKAPNVFLMGEIGSGKTASIRTLIAAGIEVFLIATEPGYESLLGDIPPDKLHWHYIPAYGDPPKPGDPTSKTLASLKDTVALLQTYDMEAIKKMPGRNRGKYNQFATLLDTFNNYVDDRTGTVYGDVALFGTDKAVVIDGLSGINNMAARLVAGDKPCMSWPEFEASQFCITQFINSQAQALKCWFIITAHIEWEDDTGSAVGGKKIMPSTIGKAIAPKLTQFFSEAILCRKTLNPQTQRLQFVWDNIEPTAKVKFRNLPPSASNPPDFGLLKANWEKKQMYTEA